MNQLFIFIFIVVLSNCSSVNEEKQEILKAIELQRQKRLNIPDSNPSKLSSVEEKNLENKDVEDESDSTKPTIQSMEERKKIILKELSTLLNQPEERLYSFFRYLKEDELIYSYYIFRSNPESITNLQSVLKKEIFMKNYKILLSDAYMKIQKDSEYYTGAIYISYPKTDLEGGSYFKAVNDFLYFSYSTSIPRESKEGGMNPEFVQYDYVREYWFTKNYPRELSPLVEVIKKVANDVDYDFEKAYGLKTKFHPGKKGAVCDDYADITIDYILKAKIKGITKIYKVRSTSMNHAWNEVVYNGKLVFIDSTWFDINKLDKNGYSINLPKDLNLDFRFNYLTHDKNLFNTGFSGKTYSHYLGKDAERNLVWSEK